MFHPSDASVTSNDAIAIATAESAVPPTDDDEGLSIDVDLFPIMLASEKCFHLTPERGSTYNLAERLRISDNLAIQAADLQFDLVRERIYSGSLRKNLSHTLFLLIIGYFGMYAPERSPLGDSRTIGSFNRPERGRLTMTPTTPEELVEKERKFGARAHPTGEFPSLATATVSRPKIPSPY